MTKGKEKVAEVVEVPTNSEPQTNTAATAKPQPRLSSAATSYVNGVFNHKELGAAYDAGARKVAAAKELDISVDPNEEFEKWKSGCGELSSDPAVLLMSFLEGASSAL